MRRSYAESDDRARDLRNALAHARAAGRTVKATDLAIIATASATGRTLHTLDRAQAGLARALGLAVSGVA